MLRCYVSLALRHMLRQRGYTAINVIGLAMAIAFVTLAFLFTQQEWAFDTFHRKADRIYKVTRKQYRNSGVRISRTVPSPVASALVAELPEVQGAARAIKMVHVARSGEESLEIGVLYADASFFDIFTFPVRERSSGSSLMQPNGIILTRSAARRLLGSEDALGAVISTHVNKKWQDYVVTGIAEDPPQASSFQFDAVVPYDRVDDIFGVEHRSNWNHVVSSTYIQLVEGIDPATLVVPLRGFVERHYGSNPSMELTLQGLAEFHRSVDNPGGTEPPSDPRYARMMLAISALVLLVACINFANISVGLAKRRVREIGVRKIVGARKRQLLTQFMVEAVSVAVIAVGVGVVLAELFLPTFCTLTERQLTLQLDGSLLVALTGLIATISLLGGGYPSLLISRMSVPGLLRQRMADRGARVLGNGLVAVQFAVSVLLVTVSVETSRQMESIIAENAQIKGDEVLVLPLDTTRPEPIVDEFRNAMSDVSGVISTASGQGYFARAFWDIGMERDGRRVEVFATNVGNGYIPTLGLEIEQGTSFEEAEFSGAGRRIIVNEELVREFGIADPIGHDLDIAKSVRGTIVGVVRDHHFLSLHEKISPLVLVYGPGSVRNLLVRLEPYAVPSALSRLRATWSDLMADVPFEYSFLNEEIAQYYRSEERTTRVLGYAAMFAILIAGIGSLGLVSLTLQHRTKEIGIRKVLGAPITSLIKLLTLRFALLAAGASVVVWPLAHYLITAWLEGFAYRADIGWEPFAFGAVATILSTLLAVGSQTARAALANPVEALRYE